MGYNHHRYTRKVAGGVDIGAPNTGDDLTLRANYVQSTSRIVVGGGSGILVYAGSASNLFTLYYGAIQALKFIQGSNVATIAGGGVTGDDLILKANTIDAGPTIHLTGNGNVHLIPAGGSHTQFGTHTATGDAVSNGSIEIKDAGGTVRKLMTKA